MAAERRAQNGARLDAVEAHLATLGGHVEGLKRRLDEVTQCKTLVMEGSDTVELPWPQHVRGHASDWPVLERGVPTALCEDLVGSLGLVWPPPEDWDLRASRTALSTKCVLEAVFAEPK